NRRLEQMIPELMKSAGVTESLKAEDPMKWTGLMNSLKAQAEEIILKELVFN
ncbi:MAG TPA: TnpV protein, partial [Clostridia bacterium]|nr:TnpV protein [Clostridia bacterium]